MPERRHQANWLAHPSPRTGARGRLLVGLRFATVILFHQGLLTGTLAGIGCGCGSPSITQLAQLAGERGVQLVQGAIDGDADGVGLVGDGNGLQPLARASIWQRLSWAPAFSPFSSVICSVTRVSSWSKRWSLACAAPLAIPRACCCFRCGYHCRPVSAWNSPRHSGLHLSLRHLTDLCAPSSP